MFPSLPIRNFKCNANFNFLSASTFNFNWSKILAFVKGARSGIIICKNKQTICDKEAQMKMPKGKEAQDELFWDEQSRMTNIVCIIVPIYSGQRYFQLKKGFPMIDALIRFTLILCC